MLNFIPLLISSAGEIDSSKICAVKARQSYYHLVTQTINKFAK